MPRRSRDEGVAATTCFDGLATCCHHAAKRPIISERWYQRPMGELRARLVGHYRRSEWRRIRCWLPAIFGEEDRRAVSLRSALAAMAQQCRTTSGPPANGSACGASQSWKQQQSSMGNGWPRGGERSTERQNAREMEVRNAITTGKIKFLGSNRRMRKTARPVVWEP